MPAREVFQAAPWKLQVSSGSAPATDVEWMTLRLEVMYTHDARGRLLATREASGVSAPRFHLGRSRHGNVWRFRSDLEADSVRSLARLAAREPPMDASGDPPERMQSFRDVLGQCSAVEREHRGPAFAFPEARVEPSSGPGRLVEMEVEGHPAFGLELDGAVVSVCHCARRLPGRGAEAGVETSEGQRGRGHAPRVVAAWARAIADLGELPFYSTAWGNRASRAVARKLGLIWTGEDIHLS